MSWLSGAREARPSRWCLSFCMSFLSSESYRVDLHGSRDPDEMIRSQEKMLSRLGKPSAPSDEIKRHFTRHLERLRAWLLEQRNFDLLYIRYNEVVEYPEEQVGASGRVPSG